MCLEVGMINDHWELFDLLFKNRTPPLHARTCIGYTHIEGRWTIHAFNLYDDKLFNSSHILTVTC